MHNIPFDRKIAEAVAGILGFDASPRWGIHEATILYQDLVQQLQAKGFHRVSINGAIGRLVRDGDLLWHKTTV